MRSYMFWKIKLWDKFVNHFDVFDNLWSRKIAVPDCSSALVSLRFYITFCTALVFDYIVPRIAIVPRLSLFLEYNLDLKLLCTASVQFVLWKLFFGIWFRIRFRFLSAKVCLSPVYS